MADGPEHYKAAARILANLDGCDSTDVYTQVQAQVALAHAQLATAAATIAGKADDDWTDALQWMPQDKKVR